jgi:hypothetical protein
MKNKELYRNIKILLLESTLKIHSDRFHFFQKSKAYKDYLKYGQDYPITGSWSLYLLNLIDRIPNDLDLVIDYTPSELTKHTDDGYIVVHGLNSLGYKKLGDTKFDYFKNDIIDTIEFNNIKFTYPIQTILAKIAIIKEDKVTYQDRKKHLEDLNKINNSLENLI